MSELFPHTPVTDPTTVASITVGNEQQIWDDKIPIGQVAAGAAGLTFNLQAENCSKPAYATLEAFIETMEEEANAAWETMNKAYEVSSDEIKHRIDQLVEDYATANQAEGGQSEEGPSLSNFWEQVEGIPNDFKAGLLAYEASTAKIEAAEKELNKYAPEKVVEVKRKAAALEASLDHDKVVAMAYADDDDPPSFEGVRLSSINLLYDVSKVIGVRKLLESGRPLSYQQLKSVEYGLTTSVTEWKEKGLVRERGEDVTEAGTPLTDKQIADMEAHINDVYNIRTKYKKFDEVGRKTQAILGLTRQMKEYDEVPTNLHELYTGARIIYNDGLRAAMNCRLTQKLGELPADEFEADINSEAYARLVEQAKATDVAEALKKLEVSSSFENLPFAFSEAELKLFLLRSVPAAALSSVKRIQFRPMTQEEDKEDTTLGFHAWSDELDGSEIIISDAQVRKHYQDILELLGDDPNAEQYAQLSARNRMLQTITHEFGHELHEILPVAALKRWEDQRVTDPTNVTAYVKSCHDSNHQHRYMEDFADTMALFIQRHEILTVISPTRFNAMQQIFEEFMPLYPETTKKLQDHLIAVNRMTRLNEGISDEAIKSRYLRHETTL